MISILSSRLTVVLVFLIQIVATGLVAQEIRELYTQRFLEKKVAIDSLAGAELGTVESSIGYTFKEPFYGVFPEELTMTSMGAMGRFKRRTFTQGDTFAITSVSYPRFSYGVNVRDTEDKYYPGSFEPADYLLDKVGFQAQLERIKKLDIDYILPLWGLIYCNQIDDRSDDYKMEKWWIETDSHEVYVRLDKEGPKHYLSIYMEYSSSEDGGTLEHLGCAITDESYIQLNFADGTSLKKHHTQGESCAHIQVDITEDFESLQNKVQSIDLSLSKGHHSFTIKSRVKGDILALKCDCVR